MTSSSTTKSSSAPSAPSAPSAATRHQHKHVTLSTRAGAYGRMSEGAYTLLRCIEVHGPQPAADLCKMHSATPRATVNAMLNNLRYLGYLAHDTVTKEPRHILTSKGRAKLAHPHQPPPTRPDLTKRRRPVARATPLPSSLPWRATPTGAHPHADAHYVPSEYAPSVRPGAMTAFALPSRVGERLYWPDGRITDMHGTVLTNSLGHPLSTRTGDWA